MSVTMRNLQVIVVVLMASIGLKAQTNSLVVSQRNYNIERSPVTQTATAPDGVNTIVNVTVTDRATSPAAFIVLVEQRRWIVVTNLSQTASLAPGHNVAISFRVRRLWKNPTLINRRDVSLRNNSDGLTRATTNIELR